VKKVKKVQNYKLKTMIVKIVVDMINQ